MSEIIKNKTAVILLNLGGPDRLENVKPFLFNLFSDDAIITLPNPFRWIIAKIISSRREKTAQEIYHQIGGFSPIIKETKAQADALKGKLLNEEIEIFIAMRHWHPMSDEVAMKVKEYNPSKIILLPLYPQFSTTTTGSSVKDLIQAFKKYAIKAEIKSICCYFDDDNFITAHAEVIKQSLLKLKSKNFRLLFSAHGLPKKTIESGDPYQWQIEQTVDLVVKKLDIKGLDYKITYQSRVGPLEWIGPNTEDEIKRACMDNKVIVVCPIAFVSEHVETLVELDIEYALVAQKKKIQYIRVPALGVNEKFIDTLAGIVIQEISDSYNLKKKCPQICSKCININTKN